MAMYYDIVLTFIFAFIACLKIRFGQYSYMIFKIYYLTTIRLDVSLIIQHRC